MTECAQLSTNMSAWGFPMAKPVAEPITYVCHLCGQTVELKAVHLCVEHNSFEQILYILLQEIRDLRRLIRGNNQ